jgi:hypothetical protein
VTSYDVLRHFVKYNSSTYSPADVFLQRTKATRTTARPRPGNTYCWVALGRDRAGNVGDPGSQKCTAYPVDDRGLTRSGSWSAGKGSAYYRGTFLSSTAAGASLRLGVAFRHLALVVTTCPTCGSVSVRFWSKFVTKVSLHSTKTHNHVIIPIASSTALKSTTVKLVQASGGKRVRIDGLAVSFL